jgi:thiol-disulfide isomerase/thioredoxin
MNATARAGILGLLLLQAIPGAARAAGAQADGPRPPARLRPAPGFSEKDVSGRRTIVLRQFRGKVVLLNFWATWCPPCLDELPVLEALHGSHGGRVVVIGASVYSSDHATEAVLKERRVRYPVLYGSYELMEKYDRVATIPTTFVIDARGRIAAKVLGARSREQYESLLVPLLEE